jgi:hypothetical protein
MKKELCKSLELFLRCCGSCRVISQRKRRRSKKRKKRKKRFIHKIEEQILKILVAINSGRVYCREMRIKRG